MSARRILSATLLAGVLAWSAPLLAQKPAGAPKNATAQCNDGTYSTAKTERGACSKHQGVKTWWGAATTAAATTPPKTATSPKSETPAPAPKTATPTNTQTPTKAPTASAANAPENATAKCKDGTYSHSKQHKGACSHHGGVAEWYK